jgi:hypothetical protein
VAGGRGRGGRHRAGSAILGGPFDLPRTVVAWISVVVGVHFFALAAIWRMSFFRRLGAAIALCGIAGLVAARDGASNSVLATLGAVMPGALLLAAGYWGAARGAKHHSGARAVSSGDA